jgi:hypothetical protein
MCLATCMRCFFVISRIFLQEWLLRLKENHPTNQIIQLEWNPMDIVQLQQVNKKFTCAVDFWLDSIVAGFITEFAVDTVNSYIAVEKDFLKGTIGRYIISLHTSNNILLYDNSVINIESDN